MVGTVGRGPVAIHSSGETIFTLIHIEGITLGAGEEVDKVAGGASGMGVDGIGEIGDRASEGQATGGYRTPYTPAACPSLALSLISPILYTPMPLASPAT